MLPEKATKLVALLPSPVDGEGNRFDRFSSTGDGDQLYWSPSTVDGEGDQFGFLLGQPIGCALPFFSEKASELRLYIIDLLLQFVYAVLFAVELCVTSDSAHYTKFGDFSSNRGKLFSHRDNKTCGVVVTEDLVREQKMRRTDSAGFGLGISDFTKVKPDGSGAEGVGFRLASVFLVRGSEPADEGVQAAPGLAERARTGSRRIGVAEKGTDRGVNLSFSELVEVAKEFQHVRAAAARQRERRPVVPQVLPERVPVAPLLILVPAQGSRRRGRGDSRRRRRRR
nr:hypothetical protein GOBAR_DD23592 [Ipomoea batatas]